MLIDESQFNDIKSKEILPTKLTNVLLNPIYTFLECSEYQGLVLHIDIKKDSKMIFASDKTAYKRMGAQNLPQNTPEKLKNLERIKGITSFESETVAIAPKENIIESVVTSNFIKDVIPEATTEKWLKKQMLIVEDKPTVAGVLIFSDEPQALLPKHCGIKIYRYKTSEESNRSFLHDQPITIEGDLYTQIHKSVSETKKIVSSIPKLGDGKSEFVRYPTETLHEILTNAVLHRDYEIKDDIHIRIYDNRVEIQSPGKLPAHITIENILDERYARNKCH